MDNQVTIKFKAGVGKNYPDKYRGMDGKTEIYCILGQPKTCIITISEKKAFQLLNDFPQSWEVVKGGDNLAEKVELHKTEEAVKVAQKDTPTKEQKEAIKGVAPNWNMKYSVLLAFAEENDIDFTPEERASTQVNKSRLWKKIDEFVKKATEV